MLWLVVALNTKPLRLSGFNRSSLLLGGVLSLAVASAGFLEPKANAWPEESNMNRNKKVCVLSANDFRNFMAWPALQQV